LMNFGAKPNCSFEARMQADGNFVLYRNSNYSNAVWHTNSANRGGSKLTFEGSALRVYKMIPAGKQSLWESGSAGKGGTVLVLQGDGNIVIYKPDNTAVWQSGTFLKECQ